ncbi:PIN domain-containing protein [Parerythrobacter lacustris]|uniref:PIN domain-containing protein n=1 Tax=Parerythrobacter lacustris TaxID=2969984 RepID=A0ABT1XQL1_9SPHN|nr:PIN domain-containing protein [Parerythrobacter lacustris]
MILLDTNVWSVLRQPRGQEAVAKWIADRMGDAWLSVIVIAEIRMGVENPQATQKREQLAQWLDDLEILCANRILAFEAPAAHIFGELIARRKVQKQETKLLDIQIAAQGLANDCPVATRNVRDFEWTGVKLIDPWEP